MRDENLIKTFLNSYFGFNKQQRNGLAVLCGVCLLLLALRIIYPYFISTDKIEINNLPLIERKLDSTTIKFNSIDSPNRLQKKLFVFNPNTVSLNELLALGFSEKIANIFLKFRKKGFVFKQKTDLKKVYGVTDDFYSRLESYILLESKTTAPTENKTSPLTNQKTIVVELNSADSLKLIEINGIGPSFAKRILKYRSLLGGFVNPEQLKEVFGFTEEMYEKISKTISVNPSSVTKINLNSDDFKTINKHPYITYEHTKEIFNQRKNIPITVEVLKEILNDEVLLNKVLPYCNY